MVESRLKVGSDSPYQADTDVGLGKQNGEIKSITLPNNVNLRKTGGYLCTEGKCYAEPKPNRIFGFGPTVLLQSNSPKR